MFNKYAVKDFLGKPAPAGYVAGLGRGATGFVTRPDIGPAREGPLVIEEGGAEQEEEEQFDDNEAGLLASSTKYSLIDQEDLEADRIYAAVDEKLMERRKTRREAAEAREEARKAALAPKTQTLFADLKRDLQRVSAEEWAALPEVGDFRAKRLKKSGAIDNPRERFLPLPDSAIMSGARMGISSTVNEETAGEDEDVLKIGEAKGRLLGMHLDALGNNNPVSETSIPDTNNTTPLSSEVGDVKRARALFASILKSDRKNSSAWISAARLELSAGNARQARLLITKATEECPRIEPVWLESIKLAQTDQEASLLLAKALKALPESESLWLLAAHRQPTNTKKILRSALERNPASLKLWMSLVEAEEDESDARVLLTRAVECVPGGVELWLALARLQPDPQAARQVLNRARQACPLSLEVWIAAARLEEANNAQMSTIANIINKARSALPLIDDKEWLLQAEACEAGRDLLVCEAISKIIANNCAEMSSSSYTRMFCEMYKEKVDWEELKRIAKGLGESERVLRFALSTDPTNAHNWIALAKERKDASILLEARDKVSDLEPLLLAECEMNPSKETITAALLLLPHSSSLALEAARFAWCRGEAFSTIASILERFPQNEELLLLASYWSDEPLKFLTEVALPACPAGIKLACRAAQLTVEREGNVSGAKVILERCRLQKSNSQAGERDQLVAALCALEAGVNTNKLFLSPSSPYYLNIQGLDNTLVNQSAKVLLGKGLKEMPWSGVLWHMAIALEPRQLRRSKLAEAQRRLEAVGGGGRARALIAWTAGFVTGEDTTGQALEIDPSFGDLLLPGVKYSRDLSGPEYDRRMILERLFYP